MRERCDDSGGEAHYQGQRDHEVRGPIVPCKDRGIFALTKAPREDDSKWPQKNKDGRQELEIRIGNEHISFEVCSRVMQGERERCIYLTLGCVDREDRLSGRRDRIGGPGGPTGVLLPRAGSQGAGFLSDFPALQGMCPRLLIGPTSPDSPIDQAYLSAGLATKLGGFPLLISLR